MERIRREREVGRREERNGEVSRGEERTEEENIGEERIIKKRRGVRCILNQTVRRQQWPWPQTVASRSAGTVSVVC